MTKIYGFEPLITMTVKGGVQHLYRFPNGYGASISPSWYGYEHEREGAVIYFTPESEDGWEFDWTTPVAQNSVRLGVPEGVEHFLKEIAELPDRPNQETT